MKKVELVFPVVKVTVEDIANLQTIMLGKTVKCGITDRGMARLKALSLIETEKLPPCPKEMASYNLKFKEADALLRSAVTRKGIDWSMVHKASNMRPPEYTKPKERFRDVVTKAGLKLMDKGSAQVEIQRPC